MEESSPIITCFLLLLCAIPSNKARLCVALQIYKKRHERRKVRLCIWQLLSLLLSIPSLDICTGLLTIILPNPLHSLSFFFPSLQRRALFMAERDTNVVADIRRRYTGLDANLQYIEGHTIHSKYEGYKAADRNAARASITYKSTAQRMQATKPYDQNKSLSGPVGGRNFYPSGHQALVPLAGAASADARLCVFGRHTLMWTWSSICWLFITAYIVMLIVGTHSTLNTVTFLKQRMNIGLIPQLQTTLERVQTPILSTNSSMNISTVPLIFQTFSVITTRARSNIGLK